MARATQRPGQTKQQTRLIAQGIQKGIDQYKKQQNAKARELDKRLKKAANTGADPALEHNRVAADVHKASRLPWLLLLLSWLGMAVYVLMTR